MSLTELQIDERLAVRLARGERLGIDISLWQEPDDHDPATKDDLSWKQLPSEVSWVCIKASQRDFGDPKFKRHFDDLRAARPEVLIGAYHYLDWKKGVSGVEQARAFLRAAAGRQLDLRPVLDLEDTKSWSSPNAAAREAIAFMEFIERETGQRCVLYSSEHQLERISEKWATLLGEWDLWATGYWKNFPPNNARPPMPKSHASGSQRGCLIAHQWTSSSDVDGDEIPDVPVPSIERWRPNKRLDINFAYDDLERWRVDGSQAPERFTVDADAHEWNMRNNADERIRGLIDAQAGVSSWVSWEERLQGIAAVQAAHGLKTDGKAGRKTRHAMGIE